MTALLDDRVAAGEGSRPCLASPTETWSYADLFARVNRIANVLSRQLGMVRGNRVLLRAPNTKLMVAAYLAVIKAGGIAVATMPLLRAGELSTIIDKARIELALCDHRLLTDLETAGRSRNGLRVVAMGGAPADDLLALMARETRQLRRLRHKGRRRLPDRLHFRHHRRAEGHVHFHRDMLATCDTYGTHVLRACADDVFIGSAPIAFTFGPRRGRAVSAACRRLLHPVGAGIARAAAGHDPYDAADRVLHRTDGVSRDAWPYAAL